MAYGVLMHWRPAGEALLVPLLLPVLVVGLLPLAFLGLAGYFGFIVLGILIGQCALVCESDDETEYVRRRTVIPESLTYSERTGHGHQMRALRRFLLPVKILSIVLVSVGFGGLWFSS
jgi:hypothetical protein